MMNDENKKRIKSISGLKVVFLFLIYIWHCNLFSRPDLGARGCEIMFLCSGFCIGYNYYKKNIESSISSAYNFAKVKADKFYLLYVVTMIIGLLWLMIFKNLSLSKFNILQLLFNLSFTQVWAGASSFNAASWFLAVLVFCYFCTPFILEIIKKCDQKNLKSILILSIILRLLIEYININHFPLLNISIHTNPFVRLLEYFMACIVGTLFYLNQKKEIKHISIVEITVFISYILLIFIFDTSIYRGIYCIIELMIIYVFAMEKGIISRFLSSEIFQKLSKYELEFYLFHQVIIQLVVSLSIPLTAISSLMAIILVIMLYKKIEKNRRRL